MAVHLQIDDALSLCRFRLGDESKLVGRRLSLSLQTNADTPGLGLVGPYVSTAAVTEPTSRLQISSNVIEGCKRREDLDREEINQGERIFPRQESLYLRRHQLPDESHTSESQQIKLLPPLKLKFNNRYGLCNPSCPEDMNRLPVSRHPNLPHFPRGYSRNSGESIKAMPKNRQTSLQNEIAKVGNKAPSHTPEPQSAHSIRRLPFNTSSRPSADVNFLPNAVSPPLSSPDLPESSFAATTSSSKISEQPLSSPYAQVVGLNTQKSNICKETYQESYTKISSAPVFKTSLKSNLESPRSLSPEKQAKQRSTEFSRQGNEKHPKTDTHTKLGPIKSHSSVNANIRLIVEENFHKNTQLDSHVQKSGYLKKTTPNNICVSQEGSVSKSCQGDKSPNMGNKTLISETLNQHVLHGEKNNLKENEIITNISDINSKCLPKLSVNCNSDKNSGLKQQSTKVSGIVLNEKERVASETSSKNISSNGSQSVVQNEHEISVFTNKKSPKQQDSVSPQKKRRFNYPEAVAKPDMSNNSCDSRKRSTSHSYAANSDSAVSTEVLPSKKQPIQTTLGIICKLDKSMADLSKITQEAGIKSSLQGANFPQLPETLTRSKKSKMDEAYNKVSNAPCTSKAVTNESESNKNIIQTPISGLDIIHHSEILQQKNHNEPLQEFEEKPYSFKSTSKRIAHKRSAAVSVEAQPTKCDKASPASSPGHDKIQHSKSPSATLEEESHKTRHKMSDHNRQSSHLRNKLFKTMPSRDVHLKKALNESLNKTQRNSDSLEENHEASVNEKAAGQTKSDKRDEKKHAKVNLLAQRSTSKSHKFTPEQTQQNDQSTNSNVIKCDTKSTSSYDKNKESKIRKHSVSSSSESVASNISNAERSTQNSAPIERRRNSNASNTLLCQNQSSSKLIQSDKVKSALFDKNSSAESNRSVESKEKRHQVSSKETSQVVDSGSLSSKNTEVKKSKNRHLNESKTKSKEEKNSVKFPSLKEKHRISILHKEQAKEEKNSSQGGSSKSTNKSTHALSEVSSKSEDKQHDKERRRSSTDRSSKKEKNYHASNKMSSNSVDKTQEKERSKNYKVPSSEEKELSQISDVLLNKSKEKSQGKDRRKSMDVLSSSEKEKTHSKEKRESSGAKSITQQIYSKFEKKTCDKERKISDVCSSKKTITQTSSNLSSKPGEQMRDKEKRKNSDVYNLEEDSYTLDSGELIKKLRKNLRDEEKIHSANALGSEERSSTLVSGDMTDKSREKSSAVHSSRNKSCSQHKPDSKTQGKISAEEKRILFYNSKNTINNKVTCEKNDFLAGNEKNLDKFESPKNKENINNQKMSNGTNTLGLHHSSYSAEQVMLNTNQDSSITAESDAEKFVHELLCSEVVVGKQVTKTGDLESEVNVSGNVGDVTGTTQHANEVTPKEHIERLSAETEKEQAKQLHQVTENEVDFQSEQHEVDSIQSQLGNLHKFMVSGAPEVARQILNHFVEKPKQLSPMSEGSVTRAASEASSLDMYAVSDMKTEQLVTPSQTNFDSGMKTLQIIALTSSDEDDSDTVPGLDTSSEDEEDDEEVDEEKEKKNEEKEKKNDEEEEKEKEKEEEKENDDNVDDSESLVHDNGTAELLGADELSNASTVVAPEENMTYLASDFMFRAFKNGIGSINDEDESSKDASRVPSTPESTVKDDGNVLESASNKQVGYGEPVLIDLCKDDGTDYSNPVNSVQKRFPYKFPGSIKNMKAILKHRQKNLTAIKLLQDGAYKKNSCFQHSSKNQEIETIEIADDLNHEIVGNRHQAAMNKHNVSESKCEILVESQDKEKSTLNKETITIDCMKEAKVVEIVKPLQNCSSTTTERPSEQIIESNFSNISAELAEDDQAEHFESDVSLQSTSDCEANSLESKLSVNLNSESESFSKIIKQLNQILQNSNLTEVDVEYVRKKIIVKAASGNLAEIEASLIDKNFRTAFGIYWHVLVYYEPLMLNRTELKQALVEIKKMLSSHLGAKTIFERKLCEVFINYYTGSQNYVWEKQNEGTSTPETLGELVLEMQNYFKLHEELFKHIFRSTSILNSFQAENDIIELDYLPSIINRRESMEQTSQEGRDTTEKTTHIRSTQSMDSVPIPVVNVVKCISKILCSEADKQQKNKEGVVSNGDHENLVTDTTEQLENADGIATNKSTENVALKCTVTVESQERCLMNNRNENLPLGTALTPDSPQKIITTKCNENQVSDNGCVQKCQVTSEISNTTDNVASEPALLQAQQETSRKEIDAENVSLETEEPEPLGSVEAREANVGAVNIGTEKMNYLVNHELKDCAEITASVVVNPLENQVPTSPGEQLKTTPASSQPVATLDIAPALLVCKPLENQVPTSPGEHLKTTPASSKPVATLDIVPTSLVCKPLENQDVVAQENTLMTVRHSLATFDSVPASEVKSQVCAAHENSLTTPSVSNSSTTHDSVPASEVQKQVCAAQDDSFTTARVANKRDGAFIEPAAQGYTAVMEAADRFLHIANLGYMPPNQAPPVFPQQVQEKTRQCHPPHEASLVANNPFDDSTTAQQNVKKNTSASHGSRVNSIADRIIACKQRAAENARQKDLATSVTCSVNILPQSTSQGHLLPEQLIPQGRSSEIESLNEIVYRMNPQVPPTVPRQPQFQHRGPPCTFNHPAGRAADVPHVSMLANQISTCMSQERMMSHQAHPQTATGNRKRKAPRAAAAKKPRKPRRKKSDPVPVTMPPPPVPHPIPPPVFQFLHPEFMMQNPLPPPPYPMYSQLPQNLFSPHCGEYPMTSSESTFNANFHKFIEVHKWNHLPVNHQRDCYAMLKALQRNAEIASQKNLVPSNIDNTFQYVESAAKNVRGDNRGQHVPPTYEASQHLAISTVASQQNHICQTSVPHAPGHQVTTQTRSVPHILHYPNNSPASRAGPGTFISPPHVVRNIHPHHQPSFNGNDPRRVNSAAVSNSPVALNLSREPTIQPEISLQQRGVSQANVRMQVDSPFTLETRNQHIIKRVSTTGQPRAAETNATNMNVKEKNKSACNINETISHQYQIPAIPPYYDYSLIPMPQNLSANLQQASQQQRITEQPHRVMERPGNSRLAYDLHLSDARTRMNNPEDFEAMTGVPFPNLQHLKPPLSRIPVENEMLAGARESLSLQSIHNRSAGETQSWQEMAMRTGDASQHPPFQILRTSSAEVGRQRRCEMCPATALSTCSCMKAFYCSETCQTKDWDLKHNFECRTADPRKIFEQSA